MIIKDINSHETVLFEPEDQRERKYLEAFPGLLREGLYFFSPCKPRVIHNLYTRISKYIKPSQIKYTPFIQEMLKGSFPLKELPDTFRFHTKPLEHQLQALRYMYTQGSCGLLLDPGLGKTFIILNYIYLMGFNKSIVICPKSLLFVWEEEVLKHRPELSVHIIKSTNWDEELLGVNTSQIIVVNYDKAVTLEEQLSKIGTQFLAIDEALIKNHQTERTKSITRLGRKVPYKTIMSGTLINNGPLDMFAPLRFIEPALVGEGITKFKARYAICAKQNQNIVLGFRDMPEIQSMIASSSIVMKKKEWLKDLPGKEFNIIKCRLEGDTLSAYNSLVSDWCTTIQGEFLEVDNPLTRLGKLLQIANGFSYINEKDPLEELLEDRVKITKRKTLFFEQQSKIRALHDLINDPERLGNRRSIIWYNFQAELEILEVYLKKQGTKYLVIQGGEKDVGGKINLFNNDPLYRFLLGQASTIRYGVTVMGKKEDDTSEFIPEFSTTISDEIFYSLNFSLEVFTQQTDRINRIGATKLSRYWLLLTNSCIEDRVYNALESKTSISKSLLIDISEELKLLEV